MEWFVADHAWLGRAVFLHGLAALYVVAFVVAARQGPALIGSRGLTPVPTFLRRSGTRRDGLRRAPSLFHLHWSDQFFLTVCWSGAALAGLSLVGVTARLPLGVSMAVWLVLWALYLSVVNVGQVWYAFGWETLLCEVGFLAVFLGDASTPPPRLGMLLLVWVLFRLEFGAGLIKMRGDACWRDLTCLFYHHETQPMPGPLSWFFHHLPRPLHRVEVAANHVTQLVVPFGLFLPQPWAGVAAAVMLLTQLWLVASGNFAWLNWLAVVLAASALPDAWWSALLPRPVEEWLVPSRAGAAPYPWVVAMVLLTALVLVLSRRPVLNLLSPGQAMNASFDALRLVNTYGAFGSVTTVRHEVVLEGRDEQGAWREYGFAGKPGDPGRWPRQLAPYHLRLDWLMWFVALSQRYAWPWLPRLLRRLLEADAPTLRLLGRDPFGGERPQAVRAVLWRYRFTTWAELRATRACWHRERVGDLVAPVTLATAEKDWW
ncbi:lipase maturation factor family protein [Ornithinimicrobium avium]|uniref:Lipase maturation factor family protein n=1 Tax=Ornithinimicrobium avium TaxID=2283195 RepID=A0A345NN89_9MICO|nr:lipase maturation factor family protein [Ornithinimicrobium avium]AXH96497.1 lipase maturation factor family protein [Ornithinimicrobium avium]